MTDRILLAGLVHETHSFTDDHTGLDKFRIFRGRSLLDRLGDGSQIDALPTGAAREGWEAVPTAIYGTGASGTVDHAVFEFFWDELRPAQEAAIETGLDGFYLVSHGAMVTSELEDPEGELLARNHVVFVHGCLSALIGHVLDIKVLGINKSLKSLAPRLPATRPRSGAQFL